ncbi:myosin-binding protein, putative (Protein of unknown function, DUF593) [Wolffia australiana]
MDPRNSVRRHEISIQSISSALLSAAAEWVVIFLLFLEGFLSYFVRRFARYSNLQPPCLLCSNLDRVFGEERPRLYEDLICDRHRLELAASIISDEHLKLERDDETELPLPEGEILSGDGIPFKEEERLPLEQLPSISYKELKISPDAVSEETQSGDDVERRAVIPLVAEDETLIPADRSKEERAIRLEELNWNVLYEKNDGPSKLQTCSKSVVANFAEETSSTQHDAINNSDREFSPFMDEESSKVSSPKYEVGILGAESISSAPIMEAAKNSNPHETQLIHVVPPKDTDPPSQNYLDLNEAYKMAVAYKMNHGSPRDSLGFGEDLKFLMSQMSSSRGLEIPWSEMSQSPRVHGHGHDLRMFDTSVTVLHSSLNRKFSFDRNESGTESLDGGSMISEIEGEGAEERLKRQIEADRKSMMLLYKELEEERSASAIAANQAMAMITRLQEEKALMHMEALQYQRMMEEQSEYDQEALQKKEQDIKDLKEEIERYKRLLGDESNAPELKNEEFNEMCEALASDFADEKKYISEWLKRLEKSLCSSRSSRLEKNDYCVENDRVEEEADLSTTKVEDLDKGHPKMEKENELHGIGNGSEQSTMIQGATGLSELEAEIMRLNERLKALEDDRSFLEHVVCSVRNENGAVQFVKEIASHLRELRRIGLGRNKSITQ